MYNSTVLSHLGIFETIAEVNPVRILDIGVGFGIWGVLIREYFDLRPAPGGGYAPWLMTIDGIEVNEKYLTPLHGYVYNRVIVGDAVEVLERETARYDLVLALNVIENLRRDAGYRLLSLCRDRGEALLVNTPCIFKPQEDPLAHDCEQPYSGWDTNDMISQGASYLWKAGDNLTAVFTDLDLQLPPAEAMKAPVYDESDLANIKDLLERYLYTAQFTACVEAYDRYGVHFSLDYELPLIAAQAAERSNDRDRARELARKVLARRSSSTLAKEIAARNS